MGKVAPFRESREEIEEETRIRTALKHLSQMNQVMIVKEKMENLLLSCLIFLSWKPLKSESEEKKIAPFGERREEIEKETRIRTALKQLSQMNQVMMMLKEKMENLLLSCLIFLSWEPLKSESEKKKIAPFGERREEIEKETRIRTALK